MFWFPDYFALRRTALDSGPVTVPCVRAAASTLHNVTSEHALSREYVSGIHHKESMSGHQGVIDRIMVGYYHHSVTGAKHRAIKNG